METLSQGFRSAADESPQSSTKDQRRALCNAARDSSFDSRCNDPEPRRFSSLSSPCSCVQRAKQRRSRSHAYASGAGGRWLKEHTVRRTSGTGTKWADRKDIPRVSSTGETGDVRDYLVARRRYRVFDRDKVTVAHVSEFLSAQFGASERKSASSNEMTRENLLLCPTDWDRTGQPLGT